MNKYIITYDLKNPGRNYSGLYAAIQIYPWWHFLESTWVIKSNLTANQISNSLLPHIDANDRLLVIKIDSFEKEGWLPSDAWTWLNT